MNRNSLNTNEETYEKTLLSEPWFIYSKTFDFDKIRAHTFSLKQFFTEQKSLNDYCTEKAFNHVLSKKDLFESKNCRALVRAGVPCKYIKDYLIKLYAIEYNEAVFNLKYENVFKGLDTRNLEEYVPYMTGIKDIYNSLPTHYLNEAGIIEVKELMWMLSNCFPTIEFSPLIIKMVSLCIAFCGKKIAYFIMKKLLEVEYNINETFKIRWHFRFTYTENSKIITSIIEALNDISSKSGKGLFKHLEDITFPANKLIEDMVYGFFMDYLTFEGVCRLFSLFMLEGVKSLYRVAYAIIKQIKPDIVKTVNPDEILKVSREKARNITDLNALFQSAYSFKLTRNNNKFDFQKPPDKDYFLGKRSTYYIPSISEKSEILKENEMIRMWSVLPETLKICDGKKLFSTEKDGFNLNTIYGLNNTNNYESNILLLIETSEGEVVACVMSNLLKITTMKYTRLPLAVMYKLKPLYSIHEPVNSDDIVYCDDNYFMIGGGPNGPAIMIDRDLNKGFSNPENCFKMPIIASKNKGNFEVKKIEIYLLS